MHHWDNRGDSHPDQGERGHLRSHEESLYLKIDKALTLPNRSTNIFAELLGVKGSSLIDFKSRPTRMHANLLATGFTER